MIYGINSAYGGNMKVLISDLDGTLLFGDDKHKAVKEKDFKKIIELQAKGHKFGSCTGRGMEGARRGCEEVPFDFIIANSGAYITLGDGSVLLHKMIPMRIVKEVVSFIGEDTQYIFIAPKGSYIYHPKRWWRYEEIDTLEVLPDEIEGFSIELDDEVLARETLNKLLPVFKDRLGMYQNAGSIDVVAYGCTKGTGVRLIQEYYGLRDEEVFVIGDHYNDLPMFEASKNAFTFPSSPKEVKEKATYIVDSLADAVDQILNK